MNITNNDLKMAAQYFANILIWIGIWGIFDNIISKYIPADRYNLRIVIYFIISIIAITLVKYWS